MIIEKDINWTTTNPICFVCRKNVNDIIAITVAENLNNKAIMFKDIKAFKAIKFCVDCWRSVAGEEYCFSDE